MRIRVLGTVDVELDGRSLKLGGPKQRAVLAILALSANDTVPVDRLVDGLWGEEPPSTAAKMVQQYVSQLRRATAGAGPEIVTRGRGYELRIDPDAVDALRFERLVDRAAAAADGGRGDLARLALELWGPPLAGMLAEPFAASEARRLEELRLTAIELVVEGDLQAGREAEAIGRLRTLVDEHPLRERLRSLLMLALYRSGRQAEALDAFRDARWTLVETLGLEPGPELRRLQEAILRQDPALERIVPDAAWTNRQTREQVDAGAGRAERGRGELRAAERELAANVVDLQALRDHEARRRPTRAICPFKGLEPFGTSDAEYFFGRERLVAEIVAALPGTAVLGVVGPSGSGKSSAVRAGLLPALAAGVLPGSERWRQLVIRPGDQPLTALGGALDEAGGDPAVLVVDQLEEVFTACDDEGRRAAFLDALVDAPRGVVVVLALRADFYAACAAHPRLAQRLGRNQVLVGPMRPDELVRAIESPAARAGLSVEPELVARLVEETAGRPGGLPLLSTALVELWRRRTGPRMTLDAYERTGGVHGAVARLAETAYASLDHEEAAAARNILLRLAGAGEAEAAVRRRVPLAELDLGRSGPSRRVLAVLTDHRLLTLGGDSVEVAHEALLREWPRLRQWLEQDAEARRVHRRITLAARDWGAGGRDLGELYRGARLASALEFAGEHPGALNQLEREFLDEARAARDREALRSRRLDRRLRVLLAGALVALVVATAAGLVALDQRSSARDAATAADAQRLGAQALSDQRLDRALLLARAGVQLDDSVATRGNLLAALLRVPPASLGALPDVRDLEIYALAVSPRGDRLAIGDAFGEVQLFDTATRRRLAGYRLGLVQRLAFSPDGGTLVVTGQEPRDRPPGALLDVLDARTLTRRARIVLPPVPGVQVAGASPAFTAGGQLVVLQVPLSDARPQVLRRVDLDRGAAVGRAFRFPGEALDPALSADGLRVLVTSAREDATYVLDTAGLRVLGRHPAGGVALALHPDGRSVALGGADGTVRLLDLRTSQVRTFAGRHGARVMRMAFTPDGRTLLSGDEDGTLIVWDTAAGAVAERLAAHAASIEALAVTPDGRTAITSGIDGRVAFWDLARTGRLVRSVPLRRPFAVEDFTPRGVAVSPDDRLLAVTQADGSVDLLDTVTFGRRGTVAGGDGAPALGVDFSPDGHLLAVTGDHGSVRLWDARTLTPVGDLGGLRDWTQSVAFSPDGRLLAAADVNGTRPQTRLWDVRRRAPTGFRTDFGAHGLAFSPDGRLLAGAGGPEGTEVRDVRTGRLVAHPRSGELARSVAFSPDGRLLFVGLFNGAGQFFSTRDWRPDGPRIRGQGQRLLAARFTPDGRTLATASADGTVLLWDVATRRPIGSPVAVQRESFVGMALSRDGSQLFALPTGTRGMRLALAPASWRHQACLVAGRELTRREWADALPGRPYRTLCND